MKSQKGFSLVELLVVVIIIAIVAAIAIPNLLSSRRAANEASAISSLRTIHSAEVTFQATVGNSRDFGTGPEMLTAGLIDATLGAASPAKSGYSFVIGQTDGTASTASVYCASASPQSTGATGTGVNYYGVSNDGIIYKSAAAADITCSAAGAFTHTGTSAPIQ
jgi:prepilin-type N-terminal cleavage/methylation domain-containing protein